MDLSFARRQRAKKNMLQESPDLASLLADIAARQAISPTAQALIGDDTSAKARKLAHPEIQPFVGSGRRTDENEPVVNFNSEVAAAILIQSKPS